MAGTTNRNLISVEDAKARLLELSRKSDQPAGVLSSPLVRLGAALLAGAYLGRRLRKPRNERTAPLVATMLSSMASTAAPMLIEQLLRGVMGRTQPRGGDDAPT